MLSPVMTLWDRWNFCMRADLSCYTCKSGLNRPWRRTWLFPIYCINFLIRLSRCLLSQFLLISTTWEIRTYLSLCRVLYLFYKSASLKAFLNYFLFQVGQVMRVMKFAERWAASADPSLVRHFIFTLLEACIPPFSSDFASSLIRSILYLSPLSLSSYVLHVEQLFSWLAHSDRIPYVGWIESSFYCRWSRQRETVSKCSSQWYCWTIGESHLLMKMLWLVQHSFFNKLNQQNRWGISN